MSERQIKVSNGNAYTLQQDLTVNKHSDLIYVAPIQEGGNSLAGALASIMAAIARVVVVIGIVALASGSRVTVFENSGGIQQTVLSAEGSPDDTEVTIEPHHRYITNFNFD
ncbi:hypothetical protein ARMGADRAFT_1030665 [Armillaria gallica]|uniref:Uncharacterized protein n=1 Tax=Armillaria gallica TaxID=47427 RepID=A0A2H3DDJ8_ARMGA|nr:hypothetical protein ARMGADRAFT_1030665 [Armillaria gallica]